MSETPADISDPLFAGELDLPDPKPFPALRISSCRWGQTHLTLQNSGSSCRTRWSGSAYSHARCKRVSSPALPEETIPISVAPERPLPHPRTAISIPRPQCARVESAAKAAHCRLLATLGQSPTLK